MFNEIDFTKIDLTGQPPVDETKRQYYLTASHQQVSAIQTAVPEIVPQDTETHPSIERNVCLSDN